MDRVDGDWKVIGALIVPVSGPREAVGKSAAESRRPGQDLESEVIGKSSKKNLGSIARSDRTKTDTGRRGEYPKALERTFVKELGKMTP